MEIIELQQKRNKQRLLITITCLFFVFACSNEKVVQGAVWDGEADFMFITESKMEMFYACNIPGNSAYIGSLYEVLRAETTTVIDRLEVSKIEFDERSDGLPYCRIWGKVTKSDELSYLLAEQCKPIYLD